MQRATASMAGERAAIPSAHDRLPVRSVISSRAGRGPPCSKSRRKKFSPSVACWRTRSNSRFESFWLMNAPKTRPTEDSFHWLQGLPLLRFSTLPPVVFEMLAMPCGRVLLGCSVPVPHDTSIPGFGFSGNCSLAAAKANADGLFGAGGGTYKGAAVVARNLQTTGLACRQLKG
ncbi:hypothetical protein CRV24_006345 [Beauveria bassiana]|nr:hypothetical protein CRV24_006345 [Beauveria bassiana]